MKIPSTSLTMVMHSSGIVDSLPIQEKWLREKVSHTWLIQCKEQSYRCSSALSLKLNSIIYHLCSFDNMLKLSEDKIPHLLKGNYNIQL